MSPSSVYEDTDLCACGHVYDEHELGGRECAVAECDCIHFELDEDGERVDTL